MELAKISSWLLGDIPLTVYAAVAVLVAWGVAEAAEALAELPRLAPAWAVIAGAVLGGPALDAFVELEIIGRDLGVSVVSAVLTGLCAVACGYVVAQSWAWAASTRGARQAARPEDRARARPPAGRREEAEARESSGVSERAASGEGSGGAGQDGRGEDSGAR